MNERTDVLYDLVFFKIDLYRIIVRVVFFCSNTKFKFIFIKVIGIVNLSGSCEINYQL